MGSLPIEWETRDRQTRQYITSTDVFIVHGHDQYSAFHLADFLSSIGLRPIILHEQPNMGRTLIEKFAASATLLWFNRMQDTASTAGYAFVLLTPDDKGASNTEVHLHYRARQNVILEMGYFMGLLGRDRVCCIYRKDVEFPSDMLGFAYVEYQKDVRECFNELVRELEGAGYRFRQSY